MKENLELQIVELERLLDILRHIESELEKRQGEPGIQVSLEKIRHSQSQTAITLASARSLKADLEKHTQRIM